MQVEAFQRLIRDLYLDRDRERGVEKTFLWLMEEVGELSVALRDKDAQAAREEIADVIAWAVSLANLMDVDVEAALQAKYPGTCARCGARPCACSDAGQAAGPS